MTTLRQNARFAFTLAATVILIPVTGCMVGPKYQKPPAMAQAPPISYKESPTNFSTGSDTWKVAQPQDAMLHGKWWEIYSDPELNTLEDKLNIDNQTIKQYFENFMEARTLVAQARSQLYPTLTAAPSYNRSLSSGTLTNASTANAGHESSVTSMGLDASWVPDLWGKVRNTIREEQYAAQLSAADLENERLTEQASLAEFFFEIRGQDALQDLYDKTVQADQQALDLTKSLYNTGIDDQISVVEAQTTLQAAQAASTNLGVARAQFEHAIAVLIGTDPSSFSIPLKSLNATPPAVPIGVPSQLLERRPDIAAAERSMAAANAQIGVATAAFYPTLTLSATGGFETSTISRLFDWSSRFWSIGPSASETIYDAGLRRAEVNQYIFTYNADVATYRQTVLTAFQQVEDYLAAVRILSTEIQQEQAAIQSAQTFVTLETARYKNGIDPYIDVVTAQTTLLADQQTLANLKTEQMTASVELIEALGGGWDTTQLPTPADVSKKLTRADTAIQR